MKHLKKIYALILVIIFIGNTFAQDKNENSTLWKIEGDNIKTSYLFGTIHILPQKDFKITDKVQKAFDACDKVALEIDMDEPGLQAEMMKHSVLKTDEELKTYLDEDEYVVLDNYLKEKIGVGMVNFNKYKPLMLMTIITTTAIGEQVASFEGAFIQMCKTASKEIIGMESLEDQMKAIGTKSYEAQLDDAVEMVEDIEKGTNEFKKLLDLYLAEDIDGMHNNIVESMDGDTDVIKPLLDDRNNNWIPKFAEFSKDESVFYAVGAGHLGGNQGVISLLKKEGYTVTPVLD